MLCADMQGNGYIYRSLDGGANWTTLSPPTHDIGLPTTGNWVHPALSYDGSTILVATTNQNSQYSIDGDLLWSNDTGNTWQRTSVGNNVNPLVDPVPGNWAAVSLSADGMTMLAAQRAMWNGNGGVYVSRDGGINWTVFYNTGVYSDSTYASSSGSILVAGTNNGSTAISTDGGLSFIFSSQATGVPSGADFSWISSPQNASVLYALAGSWPPGNALFR